MFSPPAQNFKAETMGYKNEQHRYPDEGKIVLEQLYSPSSQKIEHITFSQRNGERPRKLPQYEQADYINTEDEFKKTSQSQLAQDKSLSNV